MQNKGVFTHRQSRHVSEPELNDPYRENCKDKIILLFIGAANHLRENGCVAFIYVFITNVSPSNDYIFKLIDQY